MVTDSTAADTIHLVLEGGDDWRSPIQKYFNKAIGTEWCFVAIELQENTSTISIFSPQTKGVKNLTEKSSVWLAPISTAPACIDSPPKPKVIKKTTVKKTSDKSAATTTTKVTKSSSGTKIIRKKIIPKDSQSLTNGEVKEKQLNGVKKIGPDKITKTNDESLKNDSTNGEASGADSGISIADSDNEKSQKNDTVSTTENFSIGSVYIEQPNKFGSEKRNFQLKVESNIENNVSATSETNSNVAVKDGDFSTTFTMRLNNISDNLGKNEIRPKKMERIPEEDEKQRAEDTTKKKAFGVNGDYGMVYSKTIKTGSSIDEDRCSREQSSASSRLTPASESSDRETLVQNKAEKER